MPTLVERPRQILGRGEAIGEVALVEHLVEPLGDGLEVATGEAAVRREALGADQLHADLLGDRGVADAQHSSDVHDRVLLRAHREAVAEIEHLAGDRLQRSLVLGGLVSPDRERVLGEPARVEDERDLRLAAAIGDSAEVSHRHGLAAHRVVGDRHHDERHATVERRELRVERVEVHVAAEERRVRHREVDARGAGALDVRARGVEEPVGEDGLAFELAHGAQDPLGRPPLMSGEDEGHARQLVRDLLEPEPAPGARVGLVAAHHRGPLLGAHRARTGVGEEIDDDVLRAEAEEVELRLLEHPAPLARRRHADRFDDLDAERLDDGSGHVARARRKSRAHVTASHETPSLHLATRALLARG